MLDWIGIDPEVMGMGLLRTTISEAQLWPASGAQAPGSMVRQHVRGRTEVSAQKSRRSGRSMDSSPAAKEWRLIQRALAGDPDALSPVFVHHSSRLFRAAFSLLRNKEDAEDALQEGLLNAYIHLNSFQGRSLFSTWLTRIVMNAALMALRRKSAHPETSLEERQDGEADNWQAWLVDYRPNPEQACATMEAKQIVESHIEQLSSGLRSAFRLREMEGLSTKDTREVLGISESVVKSRLFRARGQLTKSLRKSFRMTSQDVEDILSRKTMVAVVFEGVSTTRKSTFDLPAGPDRIVLYQKNIEAVCSNGAKIRRGIHLTVVHEVGHYFGMSEAQLEDV